VSEKEIKTTRMEMAGRAWNSILAWPGEGDFNEKDREGN
jgi:hypothetical protein